MTIHFERVARVRATVEQGSAQGFSPAFLRLCKGCNGSAHPCLTCVCVRAHRRARLRMRVSLHETLATLATLAPSLSISLSFRGLDRLDPARVEQGLADGCKGSTEFDHDDDHSPFAAIHAACRARLERGGSARPGCVGAAERRCINPRSGLRAGDRRRAYVAGGHGNSAGHDRRRPGGRTNPALTPAPRVAGPSRGRPSLAVWLSAALRCSRPLRSYELHELNGSKGVAL